MGRRSSSRRSHAASSENSSSDMLAEIRSGARAVNSFRVEDLRAILDKLGINVPRRSKKTALVHLVKGAVFGRSNKIRSLQSIFHDWSKLRRKLEPIRDNLKEDILDGYVIDDDSDSDDDGAERTPGHQLNEDVLDDLLTIAPAPCRDFFGAMRYLIVLLLALFFFFSLLSLLFKLVNGLVPINDEFKLNFANSEKSPFTQSLTLLVITSFEFIHQIFLNLNKKMEHFDNIFKNDPLWELAYQPFIVSLIAYLAWKGRNELTCGGRCTVRCCRHTRKAKSNGEFEWPNLVKCLSCCTCACSRMSRCSKWIKKTPCFLICGGLGQTLEQMREKLMYERINFSLNILEEDPDGEQHKIHMRTIAEGPLLDCFGGRLDPKVMHMLIYEDKPYKQNKMYRPFLTTHILTDKIGLEDEKAGKLAKQLTDQVVNRLSLLFGGAFVSQDQGMIISQDKYVFGLTFEAFDHKQGTNQKTRALVMRESSLQRFAELWEDRPEEFDFQENTYAKARARNLATMWKIYKEKKQYEKQQNNTADALRTWHTLERGSSEVKTHIEHVSTAKFALVRHLYIAATGMQTSVTVVPSGEPA